MLDKFEQLKKKYTNSFEQKQTDIKNAWNEKDVKELEALLHKLAGSSGSYEFNHLGQLCRQAMDCISNGKEIVDHVQFEGRLDDMFVEMNKYSELL